MKLWLARWSGKNSCCVLVSAPDETTLRELLCELGPIEECTWRSYQGPVVVPFEMVTPMGDYGDPHDRLHPVLRNLWGLPEGQTMLTAIGDFGWPNAMTTLLAAIDAVDQVSTKQLRRALERDEKR